ncbi:AbrB family transcriptional regulator [Falsirhodobacter halotolerans]|uniref:AbrB family transcriptional regulator n=1 Tax=Falsirhodobacter halotolerans TaxID=1146892 RepID=UPI001FD0DD7B|nr:AbrB family transcriptional regulator [Falsirhodobacter halotolerans]MCJ8138699.1 AbrB family transcriptional regulator [Falsirhodobacter halotolerans]
MQFLTRIDWPATVLTLVIGGVGGGIGVALGLPIALLIGSLLAVGGVAAFGWRPFGHRMQVPQTLRTFIIPIVGLAIGGNFTPEVASQMLEWWPSLLALVLYIPLVHGLGYLFYSRFGIDRPTAYYGAVPGGLMECVMLGEEAGADVKLLILLQFLRLILTILFVPIAFSLLTETHVSPVLRMESHGTLGLIDVGILFAAAASGLWIALRLRFPAAPMTGPLLMSALVHALGLTDAIPPAWAVSVAQVVVGSLLGARFAGLPMGHIGLAAKVTVLNVAMGLGIAALFGLALSGATGQPVAAIFLAFAPGGVAEMSLIALSIQLSVVFVTVHHVVRIVLGVTLARMFARHFT